MFSSDRKSKSIGEALFEVGLQLTVPTVVCRESTGENKLRTFSMNVETDERRIRRSFSPSTNNRTSLLENARRSDLSKTKILRDVASQTDPTVEQRTPDRPKTLDLLIDKNNNQTGDSSISQTSTEYLSETKVATSNSLRNVFLGLWQGLNNDQLRSASSSPVDQKFFDERIRLVNFLVETIAHRFSSRLASFRVIRVGSLSAKPSLPCWLSLGAKKTNINGSNWLDTQVSIIRLRNSSVCSISFSQSKRNVPRRNSRWFRSQTIDRTRTPLLRITFARRSQEIRAALQRFDKRRTRQM